MLKPPRRGLDVKMADIDVPLSIIATTLALASFCGGAWRLWRDRPRLTFYVKPITFTNVPKFGELKMVRVMICNVGYRPIMLTKFMAMGDKSSYMGIDDEPAAIFGKEDQRFPTILQPGEALKIHPMTIESLERNSTKPDDAKTHFDPYKYFALVDSFGRFHPLDADEVRWQLRLTTTHFRPRLLQKPGRWIVKKLLMRKQKKMMKCIS